jgi:hypothetical protein
VAATVWNGEDVLPEAVGRPERLHDREVVFQPGAGATERLGAGRLAEQRDKGGNERQPVA